MDARQVQALRETGGVGIAPRQGVIHERVLDARVAGCVALEATVALPGAATHIVRMQRCADAAARNAAVAARAHNSAAAAAPIVAVAHVRNIARAAGGGVNLRGAERGATSSPQLVIPPITA